jgi:stringent starvation protein B
MTKVTIAEKGKKETINRYLIDEYVLVHVKPDTPGVTIPEHLANQPSVTLKISKFFQGILSMLEERIETELKFSGAYFKCNVPYQAIWGVTTAKGESIVWPKDAPIGVGLATEVDEEKSAPKPSLKAAPAPATARQMDYDDSAELPSIPQADKPAKGTHLKRIK